MLKHHAYRSLRFGLWLGVLLGVQSAYASATYYADCNRPDDGGDGKSWAAAKQTIQAAVDLAVASDLVLVTNGVYDKGGKADPSTSLSTNRVFSPRTITIRAMSTNPADTVIVGAPDGGTGGCGPAAIRGYKGILYSGASYLIGFTITNGYTIASSSGGGTDYKDLYGGGAHGGILSNCVIVGNRAQTTGGGMAYGSVYNSIIINNTASSGGGVGVSAFCYYCVISNNTATGSGGALYNGVNAYNCQIVNNMAGAGGAMQSAGLASNCVIRGNTATGNGGCAESSVGQKFYNCLIVENQAKRGGAAYTRWISGAASEFTTFVNCTVVSNWATESGYYGGIEGRNGATGPYWVTNCIIRFNYNTTGGVESNYHFSTDSSVANSCLWPDITGQAFDKGGNIGDDPCLVGTGDYQSRYQLTGNSRCINAGLNLFWDASSKDLIGRRRIISGIVDMGAYEFLARVTIITGH
ncbi:MAG: right-handed parallel beta-helix repeat-containing protein [Kiritimatiellae bacterium]|nr:right-handed parallel beta-helix repeat-containing protein [Kiritimatiellia bacterium]